MITLYFRSLYNPRISLKWPLAMQWSCRASHRVPGCHLHVEDLGATCRSFPISPPFLLASAHEVLHMVLVCWPRSIFQGSVQILLIPS